MATNTARVKLGHIYPEDNNGVIMEYSLLTLSECNISFCRNVDFFDFEKSLSSGKQISCQIIM